MFVEDDFLRELESGVMPEPHVRDFPDFEEGGNDGDSVPDDSDEVRDVVKMLVRTTDPMKDFVPDDGCVSLSQLSSQLGFRSVDSLIDALVRRKVVSRYHGHVRLRKKYRTPVYAGVRAYSFTDAYGVGQSYGYLVFTEAGAGMVREVLGIRESVQMELF